MKSTYKKHFFTATALALFFTGLYILAIYDSSRLHHANGRSCSAFRKMHYDAIQIGAEFIGFPPETAVQECEKFVRNNFMDPFISSRPYILRQRHFSGYVFYELISTGRDRKNETKDDIIMPAFYIHKEAREILPVLYRPHYPAYGECWVP